MGSVIKITVSGFSEVIRDLGNETLNQMQAMQKAQTKLGAEATDRLKRGLSHNGGRGKNAVSSPKYGMPYLHTGRLRRSIGFKTKAQNGSVETQIGSGAMGNPIEYAKYLQGRNGDGIRPFLWAVKDLVTTERVIEYFKRFWKPLQGGK